MPNLKHRYVVGIGHQLVDGRGKVHSTHDTKSEAEEHLTKKTPDQRWSGKGFSSEDLRKGAEDLKEHEHPYWKND